MYNFDYLSVGAIAIGAGERGTVGTPIDAVRRKADGIAQRYRRADAQVKPTAIQVKKNGIFLLRCHQSFVLLLNYLWLILMSLSFDFHYFQICLLFYFRYLFLYYLNYLC